MKFSDLQPGDLWIEVTSGWMVLSVICQSKIQITFLLMWILPELEGIGSLFELDYDNDRIIAFSSPVIVVRNGEVMT
jgi:hypothetical protein